MARQEITSVVSSSRGRVASNWIPQARSLISLSYDSTDAFILIRILSFNYYTILCNSSFVYQSGTVRSCLSTLSIFPGQAYMIKEVYPVGTVQFCPYAFLVPWSSYVYVVHLLQNTLLSHSLCIHKMQVRQYRWHWGQILIVTICVEDTFFVHEETPLRPNRPNLLKKSPITILHNFVWIFM